MKWTHPKCFDEDFISEWQATEDACELAMDFDHYTSHHGSTLSYMKKNVSAMRVRRVHFHQHIDVAIGASEDYFFETTTMPLESFANWTGKPWRLRDAHRDGSSHVPLHDFSDKVVRSAIREHRTTDNFHNVTSRWERPGELRDDDAGMNDGEIPAFLHEAPASIRAIFDRFLEDGYINGPRLEDNIYLRSWYIHHVHAPVWQRPRTIELHGHWRHWMQDVLHGWG